jgi:hypothetical protein
MLTITNYLNVFWSVVVMNCIQPVNWEYCYRVNDWLIPDLIYAWELKTGQKYIYQTEKEYLKDIENGQE